MNRLKSVFISIYIGGCMIGLLTAVAFVFAYDAIGGAGRAGGAAWAGSAAWAGGAAWLGAAIACAGPVAYFAYVFTRTTARTSRNQYPVLGAGVAGMLVSGAAGGTLAAPVLVSAASIAGTLLYVGWYSRFSAPDESVLREGATLPAFALSEHGRRIASAELVGKPAMWVFYRGNWCPICVAQIREICAQYRELAQRGVEVFFVSPQPEENSESLSSRCNAPMRFLTDPGNAVAATLGILEKHGLPAGMQALGYDSHVPRPTVILTAPGGRVLLCDRTDNYRVRPEPAQFLAVFDREAVA